MLSFKEVYDEGSLAFVAKVCLGEMCGKCERNIVKQLLHKQSSLSNDSQNLNVCLDKQYREGLKANEFLMLLDTGSTNVFVLGS